MAKTKIKKRKYSKSAKEITSVKTTKEEFLLAATHAMIEDLEKKAAQKAVNTDEKAREVAHFSNSSIIANKAIEVALRNNDAAANLALAIKSNSDVLNSAMRIISKQIPTSESAVTHIFTDAKAA